MSELAWGGRDDWEEPEAALGTGRFHQELGELASPFVVPHIAGVDHPGGLLAGQARELLIGVSERVDGDASGKVEVFSVERVKHPGALAVREDERRARIHID